MAEGSGSIPLINGSGSGRPKTCGSRGSGFGSAKLLLTVAVIFTLPFLGKRTCDAGIAGSQFSNLLHDLPLHGDVVIVISGPEENAFLL